MKEKENLALSLSLRKLRILDSTIIRRVLNTPERERVLNIPQKLLSAGQIQT